jgi:hypothetical protein
VATKDELTAQLQQLLEENAALRAQLAAAPAARPAPAGPSFGLSEGVRADLAQLAARADAGDTGVRVQVADPFTGRTLTRADLG